ncbi:5-amino-6-(5-phospho-D-ribitylamino)uracil phosphatase, chloroplastic [Carica papaya]|uniref:5-amino-6-(5-phospho-D-ribitylamino)uracil phosphatase, chloroplastic n=1 Tax=Carica papaya TaxID=3649 RepID=UPI000B8CC277|nr:5-amino-6-(5-phospho-D-ribitylamino)uracil phosphatase, chloroplastic [Carica papaya]
MVESIAATSLLGHGPLGRSISVKDMSGRQKSSKHYQFLLTQFGHRRIVSSPLRRLKVNRLPNSPTKALAMELTKEVRAFKEEDKSPRSWDYRYDTGVDRKPGLWPPANKADNPKLHNPLLRQERMGCGWLGAIFEWEGVLIEDNPDLERQAWLVLAQEEGKSPPPGFILRRIEGMKNEQAISEVLCWSRDPAELKRMASRKEDIYQALQGGMYRLRIGSREFVNVLMHYKIPMALVSTRPRKPLETAIRSIEIEGNFSVIVAAEDVHRGKPDPEMFVYAAQLLEVIPERCIVFGNSNQTVEAAHDARMKCVAVASKHPMYELGAADLVVRSLDELSVVDLKNLADIESAEFGSEEPEMELQEEDDVEPTALAVDDTFW